MNGRSVKERSDVAEALRATLISPNVSDSNLEAANVVDVIDKLACAGFEIAAAIDRLALALTVKQTPMPPSQMTPPTADR